MAEEWQSMTAAGLGREIASGRLDPRELAEAVLAAIAAHPERDRIYARLTPARARAEAAAAADRAGRGLRIGPLDGVPVAWKDLFDSAGTATEAGSALLAGRVPARDAAVLAAASRAGLVCLGKTHLSELAFSGLGVNPSTATAPNRNDGGAAPGGSSSGSAAAVSHGLAPASIGSDTGGSVRIPAAWADLVGFKTTHRLLSLDGVVPLCHRFDTVGPLCRSVEDAALLTAALGGGAAPDLRGAGLRRARLLELDTSPLGPTRPEPARAAREATARLARAGASVAPLQLPYLQEATDLSLCLYTAEAYGLWRDAIEARPEAMYHQIRDRFRAGAGFSGPDYVAAWERLDGLRDRFRADTAGCDAIVLPTVASLPPSLARLEAEPAYYAAENLLALRNTRLANLFGLCALTLPTGLPGCGLMAMAPAGAEARLLRLGHAMEAALAA
jgi:aspartyl-tRNA(Asn)/glutamyl-tRNA(Gln) amidotransferase subunit A